MYKHDNCTWHLQVTTFTLLIKIVNFCTLTVYPMVLLKGNNNSFQLLGSTVMYVLFYVLGTYNTNTWFYTCRLKMRSKPCTQTKKVPTFLYHVTCKSSAWSRIERGGGHPDPEIRGGQSPPNFFCPFGPQFGLKIRGAKSPVPPLGPPLNSVLNISQILDLFSLRSSPKNLLQDADNLLIQEEILVKFM